MERALILTNDGSHSIEIPAMGVTYHSSHGAIQESLHVFIEAGLRYMNNKCYQPASLSIFEMGFGTGLNALLALAEAEQYQQHVYYETIELYPLEQETFQRLNYCEQLDLPSLEKCFQQMHECAWDTVVPVTPYFSIKKIAVSLQEFSTDRLFDIVFFDAFAPEKQPDLWTAAIFKKLFDCMQANAVLTTYCSKSIVRKAMTAAGLTVEKIPGPPHKREMVRAIKRQHKVKPVA